MDAFINKSKWVSITNDLNPVYDMDYYLDAFNFLQLFEANSVDGVFYDPPYSPRQVKKCYDNIGQAVIQNDTKSSYWANYKKEIARIVKPNGKVTTFG